jgi:allantoicase
MGDFTELVNLLSERLGGAAIATNDDFFAEKENLVRDHQPVWKEDAYTERGKWMDGWESRRRRTPGFDWCVLRLGAAGRVRGVNVDTRFFRGNYPEACSLEGCWARPDADDAALQAAEWVELLPRVTLSGDSHNLFEVKVDTAVTHLRLSIFPDGGVARLRAYGEVVPDLRRLGGGANEVDLAASENGGVAIACSDMFFGERHNLLMPGRAKNMSDGWETKRRRGPGFDWLLVRLLGRGAIRRVELDTNHFKGNYPDEASIEVSDAPPEADPKAVLDGPWRALLPRTKLQAHTRHFYANELNDAGHASWARLNVFPDGGVSRLRLYGVLTDDARERIGLQRLNHLPAGVAQRELLQCCGSTAWARQVVARRPYATRSALEVAADEVWRALGSADQLEAFSAHPALGGQHAQTPQSATAQAWSSNEQSGVAAASQPRLDRLAALNETYRAKFGFIFIAFASGRSADELLVLLEERLGNTREQELANAASAQQQITRLRLGRWLAP